MTPKTHLKLCYKFIQNYVFCGFPEFFNFHKNETRGLFSFFAKIVDTWKL